MKKRILSVFLALFLFASLLSACGGGNNDGNTVTPPTGDNTSNADNSSTAPDNTPPATADGDNTAPAASANPYEAEGLDANGRFIDTRKITVELYDRANKGGTKPDDNYWSNWIKDGVLRDLNIEIEWYIVPRFPEEEKIGPLLGSNTAPDICLTYNYGAIEDASVRGGVLDMRPYIDGYKELLPNLWGLLGEAGIHHVGMDPETGSYYWIEAIRQETSRINTFVREDWLKALSISEPKTLADFESMLVKFKDNADTLLGADASKMVPFSLMKDVGWRANNLIVSFVPDSLSEKEGFVYGFDDRQFLLPGYKDGVRVLNKWYNMGLIEPDFHLYTSGSADEDNNIKAGNVGAFIHSWDQPYREGENSMQAALKTNTGKADAAFIAVDPFKNDAGKNRKFHYNTFTDRKMFFPRTNTEPLASAMYLDWISRPDVIEYLQIGDEGKLHNVMPNGAIEIFDASGTEYMQNSLMNIDYTMSNNGLNLQNKELTGLTLGLTYAPTDPYYIGIAYEAAQRDGRILPTLNVGDLPTKGVGLADKRDEVLSTAVRANPDQFDAIWDAGYQDYLNSGGQDILNERSAGYEKYYE